MILQKKLLFTILFLAGFIVTANLPVFAAELPAVNTISVQGNAKLEVVPDQATINVGVVSTAPSADQAQSTNAALTSAMQEKILNLGVAPQDIRTLQYSVEPIFSETDKQDKPPVIIAYRITNMLSIVTTNINSIGTIIDTALTAGANQISSIQFSKKNELQLEENVLRAAVKEADAKADAIAGALGKNIKQVLSVTENSISIHNRENNQYLLKATVFNAATPISAGTIQVSGSVNIVYEIQ